MRPITEQEYNEALRIVKAYRKQNKKPTEIRNVTFKVSYIKSAAIVNVYGRDVSKIREESMREFMEMHFILDVANDDSENNILEFSFTKYELDSEEKQLFVTTIANIIRGKHI